MSGDDRHCIDVLHTITSVCDRLGLTALRIDQEQSNDRITDRILDRICRSEFVIADLTLSKPNVYYEAGYAHAIGKPPVYIASLGTAPEFDLKDYPIIYFDTMKSLNDKLTSRFVSLLEKRGLKA